MNPTQKIDPSSSTTQFVAWIGLDWGDKEHAFCLVASGSSQFETGKLTHSAETLHRWFKDLEQRFGGRPVALAVESNRGAVLHVLAQYSWLTIFPSAAIVLTVIAFNLLGDAIRDALDPTL